MKLWVNIWHYKALVSVQVHYIAFIMKLNSLKWVIKPDKKTLVRLEWLKFISFMTKFQLYKELRKLKCRQMNHNSNSERPIAYARTIHTKHHALRALAALMSFIG
ncbi:CLUMA_CG010978, isoform A [Clunio marinus]|uniref:CLUMA_CG010978, isoform A n=1 Tax=Clunio marinus TaxID=568069 RepID=A0A1J1IBC2_9DIPT|nr:CLUMA_CG010978, isoform A [Clunio marinus]